MDRTREVVTELREKNIILEKNADEINQLNYGLLDTLAEIIDLRDPYVLGHSKRVTNYATMIAEKMGLNAKQVEVSPYRKLVARHGQTWHIHGYPGKAGTFVAKGI